VRRLCAALAVALALTACGTPVSNEVSSRDDCQGYVSAAEQALDAAETSFDDGDFGEGRALLEEGAEAVRGARGMCANPPGE
jgi:hypothetical protein